MKTYQAHYNNRTNQYGNSEIEVCQLENINGDMLATKLVLRGDIHDLNNWLRKNKISRNSLIWGDSSRDTTLSLNPRYGFSQG